MFIVYQFPHFVIYWSLMKGPNSKHKYIFIFIIMKNRKHSVGFLLCTYRYIQCIRLNLYTFIKHAKNDLHIYNMEKMTYSDEYLINNHLSSIQNCGMKT